MENFRKKNRAKYDAIHYWLKSKFGVATRCENSKCEKRSTNFNWAKRKDKEYDFKRGNFFQLCRSCHSLHDITEETRRLLSNNVNSRKTICLRGHPLSKENTVIVNGTQRWCIKCKKIRLAKYRKSEAYKAHMLANKEKIKEYQHNYHLKRKPQ